MPVRRGAQKVTSVVEQSNKPTAFSIFPHSRRKKFLLG